MYAQFAFRSFTASASHTRRGGDGAGVALAESNAQEAVRVTLLSHSDGIPMILSTSDRGFRGMKTPSRDRVLRYSDTPSENRRLSPLALHEVSCRSMAPGCLNHPVGTLRTYPDWRHRLQTGARLTGWKLRHRRTFGVPHGLSG
jgi:hypothetical protein